MRSRDEVTEWADAARAGSTRDEIADTFGVSRSTVDNYFRKYDFLGLRPAAAPAGKPHNSPTRSRKSKAHLNPSASVVRPSVARRFR